ncbi:MAG: hypothetical protein JJE09_09000, partial [Bacteroidia bacterium]|nr:hypothetical protein [Bacteroidia bacterium]
EIKLLWRNSDDVLSKTELSILLIEMQRANRTIEHDLVEFDQFVNMLKAME